ncbi:hypothetical protein DM01DRAFT_1371935 [Hesseltinella vesiculosa]|uniref:PH domain-containing protein n=1 Tax=Hesseltinella vesiculosa TaxID=101127 RepID=A0A1X2GQA9_9FUNG|nr:hypothetical protein DM01DRAFT_1371935 [Hesseltinella vesiculosa]
MGSMASSLGNSTATTVIDTSVIMAERFPKIPAIKKEQDPPPFFFCEVTHSSGWDEYVDGTESYPPDGAQHGIQPVKVLVERLEAWQYLVTCIHENMCALVEAETSVAKALHKTNAKLDFPSSVRGHGQADSRNHYSMEIQQSQDDAALEQEKTTVSPELPPTLGCPPISTSASANITQTNNPVQSAGGRKSLITDASVQHQQRLNNKKQQQGAVLMQSHFAKHGNVRRWCDAWQLYHTKRAKDHDDLAHFLSCQALPTFANIKHQIKHMLRSLRDDDRLSLTMLGKLKSEASRRLERLDQQLWFFDQHPEHGQTKEDPWLINTRVSKQMIKLCRHENKMHEAVVRLQGEIKSLERQITDEIQQFCSRLRLVKEKSWLGADCGVEELAHAMSGLAQDRDWQWFQEQYKSDLISESASYRHPDKLLYPNHQHPLLQPLFASRMERKSSVLHQWHEHIYVLTRAGFLHEFQNAKSYPSRPTVSYFIPDFCVSTTVTNLHNDLVFQLQPYAAVPQMTRLESVSTMSNLPPSQSIRQTVKRRIITLRPKCASDMQVWLEQLTAVSHRYRPVVHYQPYAQVPEPDQESFEPPAPRQTHVGSQPTLTSGTLVGQEGVSTMASPKWWPSSSSSDLASPATVIPMEAGLNELPTTPATQPPHPWTDFLTFASKQLSQEDGEAVNGKLSGVRFGC